MYTGPQRKRLRLKQYDYSENGYYFVTLCTKNRECLFGEIINDEMVLNRYGEIAKEEIINTGNIREEIIVDEFVVMPNHVHILIIIQNNNPRRERLHRSNTTNISENNSDLIESSIGSMQSNPTGIIQPFAKNNFIGSMQSNPTGITIKGNHLSSVIRGIKSTITSKIRKQFDDFTFSWQKSFYDVVIRNEEQLLKTREYILNNPIKWELDTNNPKNIT